MNTHTHASLTECQHCDDENSVLSEKLPGYWTCLDGCEVECPACDGAGSWSAVDCGFANSAIGFEITCLDCDGLGYVEA